MEVSSVLPSYAVCRGFRSKCCFIRRTGSPIRSSLREQFCVKNLNICKRKMGLLEDKIAENTPTIPEFYTNKTIFITGGTGFMGKVLIEKLLYSCPKIDKIYVLMRCKKGVEPRDRITALYESPCFDRLRESRPDAFATKVIPIPGDVLEDNLGMLAEHRQLLINTVNVLFHVAASVRFDDTLKFAATMNLRGTQQIIDLAKEMKHLSALVHTSTSYSNTNWNPVEEIMYPPHADWRDVLEVVKEVDDHTIRVLTPKVLGELPNTYAFTKQLAEHVVYEEKGKLPVVIIRPSIVVSSVEEPIKGWIDNFNGPAGILLASGKGLLRSINSDRDLISDYMPVDIAIKAMITAGWSRGIKNLEPTDDVPIINCCAGNLKNATMGEILDIGRELVEKVPLDNVMWGVGGDITSSAVIHYIKVLLLHLLPAVIIDSLLCLSGRKPMLVKLQRRIYTANQALQYYVRQQWTFCNKNLVALRSTIKDQDRKDFYYDMEGVDKNEFFLHAYLAAKKYLLKEKDEDIPKARAHFQRMKIIDKSTKIIFFSWLAWWIYNQNCVQNLIHTVIDILNV